MAEANVILELFEKVREAKCSLYVENDKLKIKRTKGGHVSGTLLAEVKQHKEEIIRLLSSRKENGFHGENWPNGRTNSSDQDSAEGIPLSFSQKRLWFIDQTEGSIHYHIPVLFDTIGEFDLGAFERAWQSIVKRHTVLRTVMIESGGDVRQHQISEKNWKLKHIDAHTWTKNQVIDWIYQEMEEPFDLSTDYMVRVNVLTLSENRRGIVIVYHHIAVDQWSLPIIERDLEELYSAFKDHRIPKMTPKPMQYADYAAWEDRHLHGELLEQKLNWWEEYLEGVEPVTLPLDFQRPPTISMKGAYHFFMLDESLCHKLKDLAKQERATPFMVLLAGFKILLHRYSGQEDICIGTPVANRMRKEWEEVVGCFVNNIALRTNLANQPTFRSLLTQLKQNSLKAYQHQNVPVELVVERVVKEKDLSYRPLFQVFFVLQNRGKAHQTSQTDNLEANFDTIEPEIAKFDITFTATELDAGIEVSLEYRTDLFSAQTMQQLGKHYSALMNAVASDPNTRIGDLKMISEDEEKQLSHGFNETNCPYASHLTIIDKFRSQLKKTPNQLAVKAGEEMLTYQELEEKSNKYAHYLISSGHVKPGDLVGFMLEREIELLPAIFGILKTGAAYVPLNPKDPPHRIQEILEDAGIHCLLSRTKFQESFGSSNIKPYMLEAISDGLNEQDTKAPDVNVSPQSLAYVIFTSGTTGKPKGVMIEHHSVINRLNWMQKQYPIKMGDMLLQKTPLTFDVSVWELFWWSFEGASLSLLSPDSESDPREIISTIERDKVSTIHFVPSMLNIFLMRLEMFGERKKLSSLHQVFCSGEALKPEHVAGFERNLYQDGAVRLINLYGPTEATVDVSYYECQFDGTESSIPIGKPIDNTGLYILNQYGGLAPIGAIGELHIGGVGLARGYLNRESLTDEKFVYSKSLGGKRLYKTGDLAKWRADGNILYLGRIDHQVKLRGLRIELGEIEHHMADFEGIREAVAMVHGEGMEQYLVGYYQSDQVIDQGLLREHLNQSLPEYMIPNHFVHLETFPLSRNGKLNRKALPLPQIEAGKNHKDPKTSTERTLHRFWAEVLLIPAKSISTDQSFFELGGHSLRAMVMVNKIARAFGVKISLRQLFENKTIEQLARIIDPSRKHIELSIPDAGIKTYYAVSSAQKRLYFLWRLDKSSTAYHMPTIIHLNGRVRVQDLKQAFKKLFARHEMLRTRFHLINDEVVQQIVDEGEVEFESYEIVEEELKQTINGFIRPFDLDKGPPVRIGLLTQKGENASEGCLLMVDMHHIISDGISQSILERDFVAFYNNQQLPPAPKRYVDYTEWQQNDERQALIDSQKAFWLDMFRETPEVLNLPFDFQKSGKNSAADQMSFWIAQQETQKLEEIAMESDATMFMVVLAICNIFLSRISNQQDVVIGTVAAGRDHPDLNDMIGMFVRTLALRNHVRPDQTFRDFLSDVRQKTLDCLENQAYPYEELVSELDIIRDTSRNPLFDVLYAYQNFEGSEDTLNEIESKVLSASGAEAKFDLSITAFEGKDQLMIDFEYAAALFTRETVGRFVDYYRNIVSAICQNPDIRISEIEILPKQERQKLLYDFNDTSTDFPKEKLLIDLFEEQVNISASSVALAFKDIQLSYEQLNQYSNRLAHCLKKVGLQERDICGIMLERSPALIVSMLAILKCGASYLPLDPRQPFQRNSHILKEAKARLLISNGQASYGEWIKCINIEEIELDSFPQTNPSRNISSEDLAYIIYTSGSTGTPKGVMIKHRSVVNFILSQKSRYKTNGEDKILQFSTYTFDASVEQTWLAFVSGATLVLVDRETLLDPIKFNQYLSRHKITHLDLTPSFLEIVDDSHHDYLKRIVVGGEECKVQLAKRFQQKHQLINAYGPTETTVAVIHYHIGKNEILKDRVPIGKPINNTQIYILGNQMELLPVGVAGHLYIGGEGLAKGYLNEPALTAQRFVENPFQAGKLLYKSGDLAKWLPDGNIDFLGRIDNQVKIRGFRIELDEIENQLRSLFPINETLVIAWEKDDKALVAYYSSDNPLEVSSLKAGLSKSLPGYMIPSYYVHLDTFPLNSSGKIDRRALPEPVLESANHIAPATATERQLQALWSEILKRPASSIGVLDNFFELGGHSLRAAVLINRIAQEWGVDLPLREVFNHQDIRGLASCIDQQEHRSFSSIPSIGEQAHYPLSSAQKRMYFLWQYDRESLVYNMPEVIELEGEIDHLHLARTFEQLVDRHEMLRTHFEFVDGQLVQTINSSAGFSLQYLERSTAESAAVIRSFIRPFDLHQGLLFRACLVRNSDPERPLDSWDYLLLLDMHHIISDGVSHELLRRDFWSLYKGEELRPPKKRYVDYAAWEANRPALDKDFWMSMYAELPPSLELPLDYVRPSVRDFSGRQYAFRLNAAETAGLRQLAQESGSTMFMVLMSVYSILLGKLSNSEDVVVGTVTAGRDHAELEGIVGMFVRTLAMRYQPSGDQSYAHYLGEVRRISLAGFEHQGYPYEELINSLEVLRDAARNPLFDVMFAYEKQEGGAEVGGSLQMQSAGSGLNISKFDLTLAAFEGEAEISLSFEYAKALFRQDTIGRFADYFREIVRAIIANKKILLKDIDIVPNAEKELLISGFNKTEMTYPDGKGFVELLKENLRHYANHTALVYQDEKLSYRQLDEMSDNLAHKLEKAGVRSGAVVGIVAHQSFEMIIGVLGIMKSGAAFLPIGAENPTERIQFILKDSKAKALLSTETIRDTIEYRGSFIDLYDRKIFAGGGAEFQRKSKPDDIAYIIYTSGSTGFPKGVKISNKSLINLCYWHNTAFEVSAEDRATKYAGFGFDASVWEVFPYLLKGASIYIIPEEIRPDPHKLNDYFESEKISISFLPTQMCEQFIKLENHSLRILLTGGDKLSQYSETPYQLINNYGPTECTVVATSFVIDSAYPNIPIGKPIANSQILILDANNKLLPLGVEGELCIGGAGLAQGYLYQEALTKARFIENPFLKGERIYKTGDRARWLPDGNIVFAGRIDDQVKLRGFRIELGEIQQCLLKVEGIREALVVIRGDENKYLLAYYVAESEMPAAELNNHLSKSLPGYMIPSYYVHLDSFPLNSSGKIDRRALPEPVLESANHIAPVTATERQLQALWSEILKRPASSIGVLDNFFELGGHSLRAAVLINRIAQDLGVQLPLREVFNHQDIRGLASCIDQQDHLSFSSIPSIGEQAHYPLSSAQKRMYFLWQYDRESLVYNMPEVIELEGEIDHLHLARTFEQLVDRHEMLRTHFEFVDGQLVQTINSSAGFSLQYLERSTAESAAVIRSFIRPFDLHQGPLFRACLVRNTDPEPSQDSWAYLLLLDMHHIISDGVSHELLRRDFWSLYEGEELRPPAKRYVDYAAWEADRPALDKDFWMSMYAELPPSLELPLDYVRPSVRDFSGRQYAFRLNAAETAGLRQLAQESGSTMFMVLMSVYGILLGKLSNSEDVVVGTVTAGRDHAELEGIVGMFVRTLAMRYRPSGDQSYAYYLGEVRRISLAGFEHQGYPYEELINSLEVLRDAARNPLFDVMFAYEKQAGGAEVGGSLQMQSTGSGLNISKFDLTLAAFEGEAEISLSFEYAKALFRQDTIGRFADYFREIVRAVIANKQILLKDIDMISAEEKEYLTSLSGYRGEIRSEGTLVSRFERQVELMPNHTALAFMDDSLSYQTLNDRANQLARYLQTKKITSGHVVGIMMDRSLDMIIAILGILKTGAAYLPLDRDLPISRLKHMVSETSAALIITDDKTKNPLAEDVNYIEMHQIDMDDLDAYDYTASFFNEEESAYIIYTSGSTGKPKGVEISHKSAVNLSLSQIDYYGISSSDRILQFSNISFDASVEQIWISLLSGAVLVLIPHEILLDKRAFKAYITKHNVTHLDVTPSYLESIGTDLGPHLKRMVVGGEAANRNLLLEAAKRYATFNAYGPTEATVTATVYPISGNEPENQAIPIGKPIKGTEVYVLGKNQELLPQGVAGELYIGGLGLAKGYINDKELNERKFIRHPFVPQAYLYATGDTVKWLSDGNLAFLGRTDEQVKIRGFRIELEEIAYQLSRHPSMQESIVLVKGDHDKYLVAYFVADEPLEPLILKKFLSQSLPAYMIPNYYVQLSRFSWTSGGKIDRNSLPEVEQLPRDIGIAPATETEKILLELWEDVLGISPGIISTDQSFFDIGGHSLRATVLVSEIRRKLAVDLPLKEVFRSQTIIELAQIIDQMPRIDRAQEDDIHLIRLTDTADTNKNLYMVHDGSGQINAYRELADSLNQFNCWGIRKIAASSFGPRQASVRNLAEAYIKSMKSIQPEGPYYLLGWSYGGIIAYEIATLLEAAGEQIEHVWIIDSSLSTCPTEQTIEWETEIRHVASLGIGPYEKLRAMRDIEQLWQYAAQACLDTGIHPTQLKKLLPEDINALVELAEYDTVVDLIKQINLIRSLDLALEHYTPSKMLQADLTYFKSRDTSWEKNRLSKFLHEKTQKVEINTGHFEIMKHPWIEKVVGQIGKMLFQPK